MTEGMAMATTGSSGSENHDTRRLIDDLQEFRTWMAKASVHLRKIILGLLAIGDPDTDAQATTIMVEAYNQYFEGRGWNYQANIARIVQALELEREAQTTRGRRRNDMTEAVATTGSGERIGGDTMPRLLANLKDIRIRLARASGPVELVLGAAFEEDLKARTLVGAIEAYNAGFEAEGRSYRVDSARLVLALELISGT